MEFSPASMEGEACTQIIIRDEADSKELEEKLNVLSKQDLITSLYNKTYLIEQLDKFISSALEGHARGALLYIALDNYEELKSEFGIAGLDLLFVDLANLLKPKLEPLGIFARMEGVAFCLLIKDADKAQSEKYAEAICTIVKSHISEINHKSVTSSTSVGITLINETISNIHDCINRAEKGASIALENGGSTHHIFNPSIEDIEEHAKHSHWEKQIKFALKNNLFRLLFQPIVSLHGEPGAHYEIYVRMLDEAKQEISPAEFIPAAEQANLMGFIDRWVVANSLLVLAEKLQSKEETRLFIKLSSSTIVDPDFLSWVSERIKALRINADFITFQVKEETALNYLKATKALFKGLRALHCRTALDSFGIEENTFQSIKHFELNYIKIHYDLISKLATNVEMQERVKSISEEVSKKNIQTITAFIEDANCLALLWQCSVDFIQGYFLQEPDVVSEYDFEESF
jgi:diguanylate cyclase (GGDEF)-like protein